MREQSALEGINDARNGLLLYSGLHRPFGESRIAFLRTPNHAMDVTDVGYVLQPNAVDIGAVARQRRLTLQHFNNDDVVLPIIAPHNCDARIPNSPEWPSDLVFDVSYGCAALKQWGDPTFIALIRDRITNINRGRGAGGSKDNPNGTTARAERAAKRARAKEEAMTADTQDDYADVVLALWTQNATKRHRQAEAKKADRTRDEVQNWLDSPRNQV